MTTKECLRCLIGLEPMHPWHDNGTWNEAVPKDAYEMPNWHRNEDGSIAS